MKILLTGAAGFLGARIAQRLPVIAAPSLRNAEEADIRRLIQSVRPDAIIHTAAISDIGACAKDPQGSWRANVLLPEMIARAAEGAKLVMLSSDQVYGGCREVGPYREDTVCPANLYAEHKLEMERRVLTVDPSAVLLRATWMYDMPVYGVANRGNFLMNMLRSAAKGETMYWSRSEYRGITWAREAADKMERALLLPGGVYNFGSENTLSMLETAQHLARLLGVKIAIQESPGGHNLWMDCRKLVSLGAGFRSTAEALDDCVKAYSLG